MSRIHALILLLGVLLIAFGLLVDVRTNTPGGNLADGPSRGAARDLGQRRLDADRGGPVASPDSMATLEVRITQTDPEAPATSASAELWRRATGTGTGTGRRSARRLSGELEADARGHVRFDAPSGVPLTVHARIRPRGRPTRVEVGPLAPGEDRVVYATVVPPPRPLQVTVVDGLSGDPVAGASLRTAARVGSAPPDFPGPGELLRRTDGDGRCTLPGEARSSPWLVVDAAGFGPSAVTTQTLEGRLEVTLEVIPAGALEIEVVDAGGQWVRDVEVQALFSVAGFAATSTAKTGRRGSVHLTRLPAGVPIETSATASQGPTRRFEPVTLAPGETRVLRLSVPTR